MVFIFTLSKINLHSMLRFLLLSFALIFSLSACGPSWVYEENLELPTSGWSYNDTLHFNINVTDTLARYNLFLLFAHQTSFPFQNLYLQIHTQYPSGQKMKDRLSIDLMSKDGQWHGKCQNDQCKLMVSLQEGLYFNQIGTHLISIEQYTRQNPLFGILSAGLFLEKVSP